MNIDQEFFRIVEELGPLGAFESHPSTSRKLPQAGGCGCKSEMTEDGDGCCSNPADSAWSKVTFAPSPEGPVDQRVTPFPKWDPQTRAWWVWDESRGNWLPAE